MNDFITKLTDIQKYMIGITFNKFLMKNLYNQNIYINTLYHENIRTLLCDTTATSHPLKVVDYLILNIQKYYSNTHSNNIFGNLMVKLIEQAKIKIINNVNGKCDINKIIFSGFGASGAINHLVHLIKPKLENSVVFVTIYEHYSNYLPWLHYASKLEIIDTNDDKLIDEKLLEEKILKYKGSYNIILSVSICSSVTGIIQDLNNIARICHKHNGCIFVDYATGGPYLPIDINYNIDNGEYYDAIFLSMHKFFGGTSTPGVLIIRENIICNNISYTPSGGTINYYSSSRKPMYSQNIEKKENGGSCDILGIIKIGLVFDIKNNYGQEIFYEELHLTKYFNKIFKKLSELNSNFVSISPTNNEYRLPIFSFQIKKFHYNYIVILLCEMFGIITRGGINCTAILAEKSLNINSLNEKKIYDQIKNNKGYPNDYGWVRITLNSTHTKSNMDYIGKAIHYICNNGHKYLDNYKYDESKNSYINIKKLSCFI